jgi:hypothetical protein
LPSCARSFEHTRSALPARTTTRSSTAISTISSPCAAWITLRGASSVARVAPDLAILTILQ